MDIEKFMEKVRYVVSVRQRYKLDAYFDLPKDWTEDDFEKICKMVEKEGLGIPRLYNDRLQITWYGSPRRTVEEFLESISVVTTE